MIILELLIRSRSLIALWYVLIVISRVSLRSPKYAPIVSTGMPYFISLLIFCCTRTIRGTRNRILNELLWSRASAALFAHSNAISVLPVPVLYIIEPLQPFVVHYQRPQLSPNWSFVSSNGILVRILLTSFTQMTIRSYLILNPAYNKRFQSSQRRNY
jgi:hypothetical protein